MPAAVQTDAPQLHNASNLVALPFVGREVAAPNAAPLPLRAIVVASDPLVLPAVIEPQGAEPQMRPRSRADGLVTPITILPSGHAPIRSHASVTPYRAVPSASADTAVTRARTYAPPHPTPSHHSPVPRYLIGVFR